LINCSLDLSSSFMESAGTAGYCPLLLLVASIIVPFRHLVNTFDWGELPHIKSYRRGEAKRSLTHN
jgi:hypothetical protein